ncbi:alpha/beta fold hydrolase [Glycomyces buryatensis]|uniref:Alpha/beta hydrolase n=1 Tax=Glycomyces buryatensis TaxID=2570927 RepID=A0A4S8QCD4_9ACTN|nr:alpha/beta hydrolase [Glycomyces buryatensis]THV40535.1 alpha/beta hydrolase [Glycomyces buryatensis]
MSRRGGRGLAIAGGVAGGVAAGAALAIGVPRYLARRSRGAHGDPYASEPFELPPTNSVLTVNSHDDVHIHVETAGPDDAALTVVFAHGYLQDSATFYFQRKAIAEAAANGASLRAVFYDQPGHGRSGPLPRTEYSIDDLAATLDDVLAATAPTGPLFFVGHSMGGMTIQAWTRLHPEEFRERVKGIAFLATTAAGLDTVETKPMRALRRLRRTVLPMLQQITSWTPQLIDRARLLSGDIGYLVTRRNAFGVADPPHSLITLVERMNRHTPVQSVVGYVRAILDHDETAVLPSFAGLPVLVAVGDSDDLTPPQHSRRLADAIEGSRFALIAEAAHSPQLEYPGEISQLLLEMIDKAAVGIESAVGAPVAPEAQARGHSGPNDVRPRRRWTPFSRHSSAG